MTKTYRYGFMTDAQHPDAMKNLVQFIIILAFLATIIALVFYFMGMPVHQAVALHPPPNGGNSMVQFGYSSPTSP